MTKTLQTFSVMFSIISGRLLFDGNDPQVLAQILGTIQAQVPSLPFSIQSDVNIALANIQSILKTTASIDSNVLNAAIAPYFARISKDSPSNSTDEPAFSSNVGRTNAH